MLAGFITIAGFIYIIYLAKHDRLGNCDSFFYYDDYSDL